MPLGRLKNDLLWLAVRALLALAAALPLRAALAAGRLLGALGWHVARGDRRRALANLALAFPALPRHARARVGRAAFASLGETAAEIARLPDALAVARVELDPASRGALAAAMAEGRGVLFACAHLGNWELLAAAIAATGTPSSIVVRPAYDPRLDARLGAIRRAYGVEVIPRDARHRRRVVLALRAGRAVGLLLDQALALPGAPVPFFGQVAWTATAPAAYAARRGIPLLVGVDARVARLHHRITIARIEPTPRALNAAIEAAVAAAPDQWVWMHRRWAAPPALQSTYQTTSIA